VEEARMNTENARIAAEIKSRIEELQAEFDFYVKKHPYELKLQEQKMAMQHSQALDVVNANNQNRLSQ
jgi:23S rRNA G2445 N2-methylase RlmL